MNVKVTLYGSDGTKPKLSWSPFQLRCPGSDLWACSDFRHRFAKWARRRFYLHVSALRGRLTNWKCRVGESSGIYLTGEMLLKWVPLDCDTSGGSTILFRCEGLITIVLERWPLQQALIVFNPSNPSQVCAGTAKRHQQKHLVSALWSLRLRFSWPWWTRQCICTRNCMLLSAVSLSKRLGITNIDRLRQTDCGVYKVFTFMVVISR